MRTKNPRLGSGQRGMVLISSLLLLLIITILGVSMFRSFSIQEKVAGNVREKQRALQAAEIAQQYAEWWLAQGNNSAVTPVVCNSLLSANLNQGQVCSNALNLTAMGGVTTVPWQAAGADIGVTVDPPGNSMGAPTSNPTRGSYFALPRFYIADLGPSADGQGEVFQVDATGYGGNQNSVAVVESTVAVKPGVVDRGAL